MTVETIKNMWLRHEPAALAALLFVSGVVIGAMGSNMQHRDDLARVVDAYAEASAVKDARIDDMSKRFDQLAAKLDKTATKAATAAKDAKEAVESIPAPEPKKKHWWSK